jgi:hypothetical protein
MLKLRYSALSKDDLKEIARLIATDKPVAAIQWMKKIREKCRLIARHPDIQTSVTSAPILAKVFARLTWVATSSTSAKKTTHWKSFASYAATLSFPFFRRGPRSLVSIRREELLHRLTHRLADQVVGFGIRIPMITLAAG